jgi:hypothetical protein
MLELEKGEIKISFQTCDVDALTPIGCRRGFCHPGL